MLQSPERDVLLVSALISIIVVLAFTDWGILAYVVTGLVFAVLLLASYHQRQEPPGDASLTGGTRDLIGTTGDPGHL